MAPPPPELMEELTEEILLRFPPDNPASLVRAALVCKLWRRLVYGAAFRHRFLEFHRSAVPLLCVLYTADDGNVRDTDDSYRWDIRMLQMPMAYFVPTTSFHPARASAGHDQGKFSWCAIDARHDRVLVCRSDLSIHGRNDLFVWEPITDEQRDVPAPPFYLDGYPDHLWNWNAAVACASAGGGPGGNCDHLNCHRGHFLVVLMKITPYNMRVSVYSSEATAWSKVTVCDERPNLSIFKPAPGVLVGSVFYFLVHFNDEIVGYDMATQEVSMLRLPYRVRCLKRSIVLMTDDDGGLGFVANVKDKLELWSRVAGLDGAADFVLTRVIDLRKVLPSGVLIKNSTRVNGFADGGDRRVLFISMFDGLYSIEINSSQVRKVDNNCCGDVDVVPYISFCSPTSTVQVQQYNFACL